MMLPRMLPGTLVAVAVACGPLRLAAAAPTYEQDVVPILRTYCAGCHNDRDMEGELSVERFATLRRGGAESGDPVKAGDPPGSVLVRRIRSTAGDHMPPADEPQPSAADLATLEAWIAAGAAGPRLDESILRSLAVPKLPPHAGTKPITAAAVSPDGTRLAVARGRTLEILDAASGRPVLAVADLPGKVMAVHFSRDGGRLVVAGGIAGLSGVAQLRDAATGTVIREFVGHRDLLHDAELSPDEKLLATAGYDRSVKLWNVADGSLARSIDVHNGAIFDVAWHPGGKLLASASADETVKLWRTADGVRLDTLNQPQGEVFSVAFTPDGGHVIAAGRDKRIHLWKLVSLDAPALNPPLHARFAHETPVVAVGLSADGRHLFSAGEDRSLKCWSVPGLVLEHDYPQQPDLVSALVPQGDGRCVVGRMDGSLDAVRIEVDPAAAPVAAAAGPPPAEPSAAAAVAAAEDREPNDQPSQAAAVPAPVVAKGTIGRPGDADCYRFAAKRGERFVLEIDAARSKSKLDSRLEVLDAAGRPVEQAVLQAVRDSWFTFRGKDSSQADDFRIQNWREMELDQYLYANGEVVKLWRYPRGPDSGFMVYPGEGRRHAFFGTTSVTHALGEPAWIVEHLPPGSRPVPNGLPVFRLVYENDDEPTRRLGDDSQVLFTAPADGDYVVRVTDVRGFGSADHPADYAYSLSIRAPAPSFKVALGGKDPKVSPGSGRELTFTAERIEGFTGPIAIAVDGLPAGFTFHGPIEIEAGQIKAVGVLSAAEGAVAPDEAADKHVKVRAIAVVGGREVVQEIGTLGDIQLAGPPKVTVAIAAADAGAGQAGAGPLEFAIRPGQTITARVKAVRHDFKNRIDFGKEDAGRNLPFGVFVDNVGLNGLMIAEEQVEREFVITASPVARPGRRLFHVRTTADGGQASVPAVITVLSSEPATAAVPPAAAAARR